MEEACDTPLRRSTGEFSLPIRLADFAAMASISSAGVDFTTTEMDVDFPSISNGVDLSTTDEMEVNLTTTDSITSTSAAASIPEIKKISKRPLKFLKTTTTSTSAAASVPEFKKISKRPLKFLKTRSKARKDRNQTTKPKSDFGRYGFRPYRKGGYPGPESSESIFNQRRSSSRNQETY